MMADVLLETAVTNWEPRFVANGVDASDYARITRTLDRWDDWCRAWSDAAREHLQIADDAYRSGHFRSAGESFSRAATYFHFAKFLFVHDLDQARAAHRWAVDALKSATPHLRPSASRHEIPFQGSTLVGLLRVPERPGPHATVLLIAGLDSAKEEFREVERTFLDRGMATFALDGPGQGEAEWTLAIRPEWGEVGQVVLAHLQSLPEVDADRIGVWGVSLGGFYAARLSSASLPIHATIVLSGPFNLASSWDRLNPLTRLAFQVRARCAAPAEAALRARDMTIEGHAEAITAPLLVIAGKKDRLFSWHDAERLAECARGETTLWLLDEGNHGCANVIYRHRPQSADWMASRLNVPKAA